VVLYREAYEEGKRAVDDQIAELDAMRQRSVQFMAFAGSATAFLIGTGLSSSSNRNVGFYVLAVVGSALSVIAIVGLISVLLALAVNKGSRDVRAQWNFRNSPGVLIREWIDPDLGGLTPVVFYKQLGLVYERKLEVNDLLLRQVRRAYWIFLVAAALQVIFWGALVWIFA